MRAIAGEGVDAVLSRAELQLLAEIGIMAARSYNVKAAEAIFEGLRVLRPDSPAPYVGLAMARLAAGDPESAVCVLRDIGLLHNPGDEDLQVFLALALHEARRMSEARRVMEGVVSTVAEAESPPQRLAQVYLRETGKGLPSNAVSPAASPRGTLRRYRRYG